MTIPKELIIKLAHDAGLADPDLSDGSYVNCDYGDCTDALLRFVALIEKKILEASNVE